MFAVKVRDEDVKSDLGKLAAKINNMRPVMQAIGEDIQEHAKERFGTSTGPDGQRWAPNARATIEAYIASKGGYGKKGITKKGQTLAANKKPLIGITGDLARQFHVRATNSEVVVGNSMVYAAIQQLGGKKSQFPNLWGDIPARPFLPVTALGDLYPEDKARVLDSINAWLMEK
jgi:phage virion morphogenesis protein